MRTRKYRWVNVFRSKKTGGIYVYFRRPGQSGSISLPTTIGSSEFDAAYAAAVHGQNVEQAAATTRTGGLGSINATVAQYFDSSAFTVLGTGTQGLRRGLLNKFCRAHGDKRIATLDRKYIERLLQDMPTPVVARTLLLALRPLMVFAKTAQLIDTNPTDGIKIKLPKSDGHHTWTEAEISQFKMYHPIGTKARLGLELMLEQGMRRSDVIRVGRQHMRNGEITITQKKTGEEVTLEVNPELAQAIAAYPSGHLTFLTTDAGAPFDEGKFNKWFRKEMDAAGLPARCVPHGVRKGFTRRLAEAGCTTSEMAASTGHLTLQQVDHYAKKFNRKLAAKSAMAKKRAAHAAEAAA
jgi:integrase